MTVLAVSVRVALLGAIAVAFAVITLLPVARRSASAAHEPGRTYVGRTSQGGIATVWVSADGARARATFEFANAPAGCPPYLLLTSATVTEHAFAFNGSSVSVPARFVVTGAWDARGAASGRVLVTPATGSRCPSYDVTWTAEPSDGATAGAEGVPSSGFGLFSFSGGSEAQLVGASRCSQATLSFWVTDGRGGFVAHVPAATVRVVNEAWRARFAGGIPPGTPVIGRCE